MAFQWRVMKLVVPASYADAWIRGWMSAGSRMQDPQKQHVLPAPCDIDSYSFSAAKGALLSASAAFTFCFIKFSPLRFVLCGVWKYEVYLTRHVRVYCIFLLLL